MFPESSSFFGRFSLFEHFNLGQTLLQRAKRISPASGTLAALLNQGIARGEGGLDVAAGVRVPSA